MKTSSEIGELFAALALAKLAYKPLMKTKFNTFFKSYYSDLADVQDATSEALSQQGLAIVQGCNVIDGRVVITTLLGHKSGQWIETQLSLKPDKDTAQGIGSAMTYGNRYSWQAIVGISGEPDDDGNAAEGNHEKKPKENKAPPTPPLPPAKEFFNMDNDKHYLKFIAMLKQKLIPDEYHGPISLELNGKEWTEENIKAAIVMKGP